MGIDGLLSLSISLQIKESSATHCSADGMSALTAVTKAIILTVKICEQLANFRQFGYGYQNEPAVLGDIMPQTDQGLPEWGIYDIYAPIFTLSPLLIFSVLASKSESSIPDQKNIPEYFPNCPINACSHPLFNGTVSRIYYLSFCCAILTS